MITALVAITLFITPALATNNGQFVNYYPEWEPIMRQIINESCSVEYAELIAQPERGSWILVSCLLDNFTEVRKTEMAIVSVLLGLLPMAVQLVGPRIVDVAELGFRRPVLATLICLGSTSATLQGKITGVETMQVTEKGEKDLLWPERLVAPSSWTITMISIVEYILVGTAAVNSIVQGYQLSFWAVSFISMITGSFGHTAEAFSPLLWVFLCVPILALSMQVLHLERAPADTTPPKQIEGSFKRFWLTRAWESVKYGLAQEAKPCAWKDAHTKAKVKLTKKRRYWIMVLNWSINLLVWVQIIYGTIVLSSELFISLFTSLQVLGRFLSGAIVCRAVLEFEMYGLREISKSTR